MATIQLTSGNDSASLSIGIRGTFNGARTSWKGSTIDAMAGNDTLIIDDSYRGYNNGHFTLTTSGNGVVTLTTASGSANFTNFEHFQFSNLTIDLGTAGNDSIIGSTYADPILFGLAGNDTINGGAGADSMYGGIGNDTYIVDNAADIISELSGQGSDTIQSSITFSLADTDGAGSNGGNVENLTLTGSAAINATGNALANTLIGNSAANILNGGAGIDTANYGNSTAAVTANLTTNTASGFGTDTFVSIENLVGSKFADNLTGNAGANVLRGGLGKDTLDGGAGADTADYSDKTTAVSVTLNGSTNAVVSIGGVAEDTIKNIENLNGGTGTDTLTGDANANVLKGGLGKDTLDGGGGSDTADYSDKSAALSVSLNGATSVTVTLGGVAEDSIKNIESVNGGSGIDTIIGDALANRLTGNGGADILSGGLGNDTLTGGIGYDKLTGGGGNDIFKFTGLSELGKTSTGTDVIADFLTGDKIDLSAIDAIAATSTVNDAFSYLGSVAGFTGAGQLRYDSGAHVLYGNTDSNTATAEFAIVLTGVSSLASTDFTL